MVKIKVLKESEERIQLLLTETDRSFANAVRRTLISDTPKMAIDSVRFQLLTLDFLHFAHRYSVKALRRVETQHVLSLIHISEPTRPY